jgi:hypothetical protein
MTGSVSVALALIMGFGIIVHAKSTILSGFSTSRLSLKRCCVFMNAVCSSCITNKLCHLLFRAKKFIDSSDDESEADDSDPSLSDVEDLSGVLALTRES